MTSPKPIDRLFFSGFALYFLAVNVVGFSTNIYRSYAFGTGTPGNEYVHGVFAASWVLLFTVQTLTIGSGRTKLHMRLGKLAIPILILVLITGYYVALRPHQTELSVPVSLVSSEFGLFTLVTVLGTLGIVYRRRPSAHKRYMLMTIIMMSTAGLNRVMQLADIQVDPPAILFVLFWPLLLLLAYDIVVYRRLFLPSVLGVALLVLTLVNQALWTPLVTHLRALVTS